jgi:hypothetical protein
MTGSDFSITNNGSVSAVFNCDGQSVSIVFYANGNQVGCPVVFARSEAVEVGKRVADTGIYEDFPVSGVLLADLKNFGVRLRQYGETGS